MSREITDKMRPDLPVETKEWLHWLETEREASRHTLDNYGRDLRRFLAFLDMRDCRSFEVIGPDMVQAFVVAEVGQGRSQRSVARELSTLRGFFKFLVRKGAAAADIVGSFKPLASPASRSTPADHTLSRAVAGAQEYAELAWVGCRDRALFLLMLDCGLSLGEALALRQHDLPSQAGALAQERDGGGSPFPTGLSPPCPNTRHDAPSPFHRIRPCF